MKPRSLLLCLQKPATCPYIDLVNLLTLCILKIHFNIILLFRRGSTQVLSYLNIFRYQFCVNFPISTALATYPTHHI